MDPITLSQQLQFRLGYTSALSGNVTRIHDYPAGTEDFSSKIGMAPGFNGGITVAPPIGDQGFSLYGTADINGFEKRMDTINGASFSYFNAGLGGKYVRVSPTTGDDNYSVAAGFAYNSVKVADGMFNNPNSDVLGSPFHTNTFGMNIELEKNFGNFIGFAKGYVPLLGKSHVNFTQNEILSTTDPNNRPFYTAVSTYDINTNHARGELGFKIPFMQDAAEIRLAGGVLGGYTMNKIENDTYYPDANHPNNGQDAGQHKYTVKAPISPIVEAGITVNLGKIFSR